MGLISPNHWAGLDGLKAKVYMNNMLMFILYTCIERVYVLVPITMSLAEAVTSSSSLLTLQV